MKIYVIGLLILFATISMAIGHGEERHDKHDSAKVDLGGAAPGQGHDGHGTSQGEAQYEQEEALGLALLDEGNIIAPFDEFPNLHPLIVHFPVVLLLIAALFQIAQFFVLKRSLGWIVLILVIGGFVGALIAGTLVHPHPEGLSEAAKKVLEQHEAYASLTMWLSGIGAVSKALSQLWLKGENWPAEILVAIALISAAFTVSKAGHYGSQLVYIEGVGPQGKYLETEGHEH